ncbi:MAG: hypothetical protein PHN32_03460 [Actinomycetota bacterium]|jgi:hypothetical protein|nr:hypothetical protein [Actinomycetota bacterium]
MPKKMHSFRLDQNLIKKAKARANQLGISLSAFVSLALSDKIAGLGPDNSVARELKLLRKHLEQRPE